MLTATRNTTAMSSIARSVVAVAGASPASTICVTGKRNAFTAMIPRHVRNAIQKATFLGTEMDDRLFRANATGYGVIQLLNILTDDKRPCRTCGKMLWFVTDKHKNMMPVTAKGTNHLIDCPNTYGAVSESRREVKTMSVKRRKVLL